MQKKEVVPYLAPCAKPSSTWVGGLNVRAGTINSGENTGVNLRDCGSGSGFLAVTPKAHTTKNKLDVIKVKNLCFKGHHQKSKTTHRTGENFYKSYYLIKELYLDYTKKFYNSIINPV